jgi:hypothetical protein
MTLDRETAMADDLAGDGSGERSDWDAREIARRNRSECGRLSAIMKTAATAREASHLGSFTSPGRKPSPPGTEKP